MKKCASRWAWRRECRPADQGSRPGDGDFGGQEGEDVSGGAIDYLRITVEQPLRLYFEVRRSSMRTVLAAEAVAKLVQPRRPQRLATKALKAPALRPGEGADPGTDPDLVDVGLGRLHPQEGRLGQVLRPDEELAVADRKGNPEPDPELRDNRNITMPPVQGGGGPDWNVLGSSIPGRRSMTTMRTRCSHTSAMPWSIPADEDRLRNPCDAGASSSTCRPGRWRDRYQEVSELDDEALVGEVSRSSRRHACAALQS